MTSAGPNRQRHAALYNQVCWFIRLRWGAGAVVVLGALADRYWLNLFEHTAWMLAVGTLILAYNAVLRVLIRAGGQFFRRYTVLVTVASVQIIMDLLCLTFLTLWTGGARSPLLGFYVYHIMISSLLLPRTPAYAVAGGVVLVQSAGLWLTRQWPHRQDSLLLLGWMLMLVITVYLATSLMRSFRRHRMQLLRQGHRIRTMADELHRQTQAMVQQDKMVAMGQMAAGIAHEIANPLASMDSLLQLVQRHPERLREGAAERLREQISRVNQIVRDLTHFAHPAQKEWRVVPIDEAIRNALQMVRFDRRLRDVELVVNSRIPQDQGRVSNQPQAMEQVLVNLIINALDAMADQPHPRLEINSYRQENRCCIEVIDNGHGIRPEHRDRILEPFFTTKPVGKGTGLGLSISYRLVRSHGGDLTFRSLPTGTCFQVSLPVAQ